MKFNEHGLSVLCPYVAKDEAGVDQFCMSRLNVPAGWDKRKVKRCIRHFYEHDLGISIDISGINKVLKNAVPEFTAAPTENIRDKFIMAVQALEEDATETDE